jgi:hypothetical protein
MPVAVNPSTGETVYLSPQGTWEKAQTAVNPQTKEMLAFDGKDWQPVKSNSKGVLGYVDDAVRSLASGITFGYADELAAKMDELTGRGGTYEQNIANERARDEQIPSAISVPGNIAGSVASTVLAAPIAAGARAVPAVNAAAQALPTWAKFGALGAAEGGLAGSGNAVEGERLGGAAVGGAIGAPIGAVAPSVVNAGAQAIGKIRAAGSPEANVAADLARAITRDETTPEVLTQKLVSAANERPGVVTLADVGGENVRGLVERVAQTPGAGRTQVVPALTARQQSQAARVTSDLRSLTGTTKTAKQAIDDTIAERSEAAKPLYKEAFNFNARAVPEVVEAFERETASGYGKAILNGGKLRKTLQTEYGIQDPKDAPMMVLIDAWKKEVDDLVGGAVRGGEGNTSRVLTGMQKRVLEVVDAHNPKYAEARNAWAGPSKYLDAVEDGRNVLSTKVDAEELVARFAKMSDADKEAYRIGAVSSLVAKMGNDGGKLADMTKYLRSPEARAKIAAIMPTPEAAAKWAKRLDFEVSASELTGRSLGNSATARRLAEQEDAKSLAADLVRDAVAGAPMGLLKSIAMTGPKWIRDTLRSKVDAELGDVLTNPARVVDLLDVLKRTGQLTKPQPRFGPNITVTAGGSNYANQ